MSTDTYHCPVCGKPFDLGDKLFDFAIAAHEKDHKPENNSPANYHACAIDLDDPSVWLFERGFVGRISVEP